MTAQNVNEQATTNGWDLKELSEVVNFNNGKAHENSISENGKYIVVNSKFISTQGEVIKRSDSLLCPSNKDDILMVMSDVPNGKAIAKCFYVDKNNVYTVNQRICRLTSKINPKFLYYKIDRNPYFLSFDDGVKQTNLKKSEILACKINIPVNDNEQAQIAQVLSDLDSLIQKTEKLIEKKRVIRKGLIHNLLSGTQRLHGFENNWVTEKLTELCWFQEGPGVRTSQFTNSGVKLLNGTNINKNQLNLDTTERYIPSKLANGAYAHFLADNDDIVIASSGISVEKFDEKVAFVEKKDLPLCMNTSTIRFKSYSNKMTKEYLFYFLQSDSFKKHIGEQATGSAQLNFGPYHLNRLSVHLPKDIDEQTAIAETLSFVDSEIHLLDKKLVKYNQIKQGAMQVLLTGKIRLNPNPYAKPITQSRTN